VLIRCLQLTEVGLYLIYPCIVYVFVDLGVQPAIRMRHIIILVLPVCTFYLLIISYTARFAEKVIRYKLCFNFI